MRASPRAGLAPSAGCSGAPEPRDCWDRGWPRANLKQRFSVALQAIILLKNKNKINTMKSASALKSLHFN